MTYKTFIRSWNNDTQKIGRSVTQETGLTETVAHQRCETYNNNRNARQIRNNTKMEYRREA